MVARDVVLTETLVETLAELEAGDMRRIIHSLEGVSSRSEHLLDRLAYHPGYKLRVGDFRLLIHWDTETEVLYAIDAFELRQEPDEQETCREVWIVASDD